MCRACAPRVATRETPRQSDASVVNRRKIQLREGRIEAALSMKDTGPESASRREGRSQRQ